MNNYFEKYSKEEISIFQLLLEEKQWFKDIVLDYKPNNTAFHDIKCKLKDGNTLLVEIKKDEKFWFEKTGNIGLDFISAFKFKTEELREKWLNSSFWIKKEDIEGFLNDIEIIKMGKLLTCDADVQVFYVEDNFIKIYDNSKLQSDDFIDYLKKNFDLRINKKSDYGINEDWESSAFFVPAKTDETLSKCEINSVNALIESIKNNKHTPDN